MSPPPATPLEEAPHTWAAGALAGWSQRGPTDPDPTSCRVPRRSVERERARGVARRSLRERGGVVGRGGAVLGRSTPAAVRSAGEAPPPARTCARGGTRARSAESGALRDAEPLPGAARAAPRARAASSEPVLEPGPLTAGPCRAADWAGDRERSAAGPELPAAPEGKLAAPTLRLESPVSSPGAAATAGGTPGGAGACPEGERRRARLTPAAAGSPGSPGSGREGVAGPPSPTGACMRPGTPTAGRKYRSRGPRTLNRGGTASGGPRAKLAQKAARAAGACPASRSASARCRAAKR